MPVPPSSSRPARGPARRVTLDAVAQHAGVGAMTVSRVLREPGKVSPELRQRVQASIEALGYRANHVASGLASGHTRVVPILIPTLAHPVYVPFVRGVHDALHEAGLGHEVIVATSEYDPLRAANHIETLLDWSPAGLMVAGVDHQPRARQRLLAAAAEGVPVIEFMDLAEQPIDLNIGFDHRAVGEYVAAWLLGRGHRQIGYLGAMAALDSRSEKRVAGFAAVLAAAGVDLCDIRFDEPSSMALGGQGLAAALTRSGELDALFCANDELAAGAIFEASRRGIAVPRQLTVIGFNDTDIAAAMHPSISTVAIDRYAMGRQAAALLLRRRAEPDGGQRRIDTGFQLIERASSARDH